MNIRPFLPEDAAACFRLRCTAFITVFNNELEPDDIAAAVNACLPADYMEMAENQPFFVVEKDHAVAGFFSIIRKTSDTAHLPLIYLDLDHTGIGLGSACMAFIKKWISENWQGVSRLVVDTVIPEYNSGFYVKMGFSPEGPSVCEYGKHKIKSLRLVSRLN